jgi:hypothetical protein
MRWRAEAEKRKAAAKALKRKIEQFDALPHSEQEKMVTAGVQ